MPKNQVSDLITDQEIAFARLLLSGTMTDRQAAEAAGLNPVTASYTKTRPRVRAYMLEHRAAMHERLVQQETEESRRLKLGRERLLARLWDLADMDPEKTRNSLSAQIKALSMIAAIEGLIPDRNMNRNTDRRAASAQNKSALPPIHPQELSPDLVRDEDGLGDPDRPPSAAADAPFRPVSVSASAPGARVSSSTEKKPDTWRLRL
jgi:hypothetical protein